jgi:uncharacterized protein (DUF1684 family)
VGLREENFIRFGVTLASSIDSVRADRFLQIDIGDDDGARRVAVDGRYSASAVGEDTAPQ